MNKNRLFATLSVAVLSISSLGGVVSNASNMSMMHGKYMKMAKHHRMNNNMNHSAMHMSSSLPKGLVRDHHAKFKVNQAVTIKANHMMGMYNAKGKVVGAYKTNLYEIDYTSTTTGKKVKNHKWVIAKELKAKGKLVAGKKVTVLADHMNGMKHAKGKIVKVHRGPAYVVTYTDKKTHKVVKNHKWLVQSELKAR